MQFKKSSEIMGDVADPQVILPETVDKCSDFHSDVIRWAEVTRAVWLIPMDSNDAFFEHNWAAPTDACQGIIKYNRVSVGCGGIKTMSAISINRSDWCRLVWLRNVPSD